MPGKKQTRKEPAKDPGYPPYPAEEDIYNEGREEPRTDPDNPGEEDRFEKDTGKGKMGNDLDVPGSELDDAEEAIGEEDEENNYYSLGGDVHDDPDEADRDELFDEEGGNDEDWDDEEDWEDDDRTG